MQAIVLSKEWRYVNTRDNPADIAFLHSNYSLLLCGGAVLPGCFNLQSTGQSPLSKSTRTCQKPESSSLSLPIHNLHSPAGGSSEEITLHLSALLPGSGAPTSLPPTSPKSYDSSSNEIEDARLYLLLLVQQELFPDELCQLRRVRQ